METKKGLTAADLRVGQKVWVEINDNEPDFATHIVAINQDHYGITVTNESGVIIGIKLSEMKPILRRFESMSEADKADYWNNCACFVGFDDNGDEIGGNEATIKCTSWLQNSGYDCGAWVGDVWVKSLIDAGLAIDAATLKGETNG